MIWFFLVNVLTLLQNHLYPQALLLWTYLYWASTPSGLSGSRLSQNRSLKICWTCTETGIINKLHFIRYISEYNTEKLTVCSYTHLCDAFPYRQMSISGLPLTHDDVTVNCKTWKSGKTGQLQHATKFIFRGIILTLYIAVRCQLNALTWWKQRF